MIDEDDLPNQELLPMIYLYIVFCIIILIFKIIVFYHIVSLSVDSSTDTDIYTYRFLCLVSYLKAIFVIFTTITMEMYHELMTGHYIIMRREAYRV